MARYVVKVRSPRGPDEAFAYLADLTNFAEWDPGVVAAEAVSGDGPAPGARYDVSVRGIGRPLTLRYELTTYEPPRRVVAEASSRLLTSHDTITVEADGAGSIVTYDAALTLNGPLGLADPLLRPFFRRIGDRAAEGLIGALDGERVG